MHQEKPQPSIRIASDADFQSIWPIFQAIVSRGDTYAFPTDITPSAAKRVWLEQPRQTFIYEEDGEVLGTYFIKTNQSGPGDHVCNCGYMVAASARGRGVATALCKHSQDIARELGYRAMQFNLVVSTNTGAVRLWQSLGFDIVGTLPGAFRHPDAGDVDAYIMYKQLTDGASAETQAER